MAKEQKDMTKVEASPLDRRREQPVTYRPLVDIYEDEQENVILVADMPGATDESVDVTVERGVLTITAEAPLEAPGEGYSQIYAGFGGGRYLREFALSDEIDRERIEASLSDGVLTVRMPRAAAAKTRRIKIKGT